jgi:hypothetical protein
MCGGSIEGEVGAETLTTVLIEVRGATPGPGHLLFGPNGENPNACASEWVEYRILPRSGLHCLDRSKSALLDKRD